MALLSVAASPSTEFSGRSGSSNYSFSACMHSSVIVGQYGGRLPFPRRPRPFVPPFEFFTTPGVCNSHVGTWSSDAPGDICHTDALCPTAVCARSLECCWGIDHHCILRRLGTQFCCGCIFHLVCCAPPVRFVLLGLICFSFAILAGAGVVSLCPDEADGAPLTFASPSTTSPGGVVLAHSPLLSKRLRLTQPAPRLNSRVCSRHSQWCRLLRLELSLQSLHVLQTTPHIRLVNH